MPVTPRENFEYTGGSVPIDPTYASAQVIDLLDEYNYQLDHENVPDINPFNEKLIAKNKDGKFYEIPSAIQEQAIRLWLKRNKTKRVKFNNRVEEIGYDEDNDSDGDVVDKSNSTFTHIFIYVIVISLLIVLGYFALKKVNTVKSF